MRAIHLYCDLVAGAVLDGLQAEAAASGVDIGARAELPIEDLPEEPVDGLAGEVQEPGAGMPPAENEPAAAHA
jgi:small subunit ribosomal protein S2